MTELGKLRVETRRDSLLGRPKKIFLDLICSNEGILHLVKFGRLIQKIMGIMCNHVMLRGHGKASFRRPHCDVGTHGIMSQKWKHQMANLLPFGTAHPIPRAEKHSQSSVHSTRPMCLSMAQRELSAQSRMKSSNPNPNL